MADKIAARTILPLEGVEVMTEVARIFAVTGEQLVGEKRTARLSDARSVIAAILTARGWTTAQVGELLNRNQSTAYNLVQRISKDFELRRLAKELAA
jgi:chromosomal replication initiation ATPase DnaA